MGLGPESLQLEKLSKHDWVQLYWESPRCCYFMWCVVKITCMS